VGVKGEVWGIFPGALWAKSLKLNYLFKQANFHEGNNVCLPSHEQFDGSGVRRSLKICFSYRGEYLSPRKCTNCGIFLLPEGVLRT